MSKQYCFYCGEFLGDYKYYDGDIETCGKSECEREARFARQEQDAEAREQAERDNYDRYR